MRHTIITLFYLILAVSIQAQDRVKAVDEWMDRIGGSGTSARIEAVLDTHLAADGEAVFEIAARQGKPQIKGTSVSALTTGVNWYLNHYAKVNLSWNRLSIDLSEVVLPVPAHAERHTCDADYRYYLNYCTFSYSMATWTWQRWEQEIDWMAMHGINMPLQLIGLDVVWKAMLEKDFGYSRVEANAFVAGPAFQAWWGMNNLEGWGGPNPEWWYERQLGLAQKIIRREKELGMMPVLPGFSGMVPSNFEEKTGIACQDQGTWAGFVRPKILDPTSASYAQVAEKYYNRLHEVMGKSDYYSMDPFHEGGRIQSGQYREGYQTIFNAMNQYCGPQTKWVIQQWQWEDYQALSLEAVPAGRLIVLDLFSDGKPCFDQYKGYGQQHAVYCSIPNFGGRTGFFGRIPRMGREYFQYKSKYPQIKGIGAAPEAIEQTPVVYDFLFELPWMGKEPDSGAWMSGYAEARYGMKDAKANEAWQLILQTVLNNTDGLQGAHEAVMCARPSLEVKSVSTWGGTRIFYQPEDLRKAVRLLMESGVNPAHPNYSYDLCDMTRQVLSDYSLELLGQLKEFKEKGDINVFNTLKNRFMELILDTDKLLATNSNFRLGHWTERARDIANESAATTDADREWLEMNARMLITTWGDKENSDKGGLRDYSYRQWQGMLKDFYYPRWKYYFDHDMQAAAGSWFYGEWEWAHNLKVDFGREGVTTEREVKRYPANPEGNTLQEARKIMDKYFK
ncbi:MAG: alpha-N-acetylglucosaminidase [Bacteroidaceae bacterium]|nr:alpha-N-acetylglucosaminidase [Bacteroidaceae bacterium]